LTEAEEKRYYGLPEACVLVIADQCSGILEKEHNAQQESASKAEKEANMKYGDHDRGEIL
jgi:hypothetical protein